VAKDLMRRALFDLLALGLLLGVDCLIAVLGLKTDLPVALSIPIIVGFGRGFAERRYLDNTLYWMGGIEWTIVVIIEYAISCYIGVLLRPYDNFETVFGFGLLVILTPSLILSLISYGLGFRFARRR
jgi:hypothetical protein